MSEQFHVPELGALARMANAFMRPIMRLPIISYPGESPQETHFWNNIRVPTASTDHLDRKMMVSCTGDRNATWRLGRWDVRFHVGGWSEHVILEPVDYFDRWYVGWITQSRAGVSQIPISGKVRMLIGPEETKFFGVRSSNNTQIFLRAAGHGRLGDGLDHQRLPLH